MAPEDQQLEKAEKEKVNAELEKKSPKTQKIWAE
jgi:hypothetical protein